MFDVAMLAQLAMPFVMVASEFAGGDPLLLTRTAAVCL
jgi:hypothetical protein